MKKTILITGINGFLGSHIARNLYKDYDIVGLVKSSSDNYRVKDLLPHIFSYNVEDYQTSKIFEKHKIEMVIHTATNYGKDGDLIKVIESNLLFPLQILQLGISHKIKAFINTDTFYLPSYEALQHYSLSKKHFLDWAKLLSKNIKIINLTIGIIFGPTDHREKFTPSIIKRMLNNELEIDLTDGFQKRNFLYVEEAARIYRTIVEKIGLIESQFNNFNIGTGESTSIREYIKIIHRLTNSQSKLNFGAIDYRENEIMNPDNDISEILKLGWKPMLSLDEALLKTIVYEKNSYEQ